MIYSGSWSPQLQLPRLSLWMSQRASPCRGWLSKTITTWLWPTEALKLVVQHETHHVSSCFNPSPKYQQYPTVSNSQYVRWVHGDDHPISRRWTHTHTFETTTSQMWSLVEHLGKSVSYGGKLQEVRNLQRNIGPIHHQEPRYSNNLQTGRTMPSNCSSFCFHHRKLYDMPWVNALSCKRKNSKRGTILASLGLTISSKHACYVQGLGWPRGKLKSLR